MPVNKLDAHVHFWHYSDAEYGWIPEEMAVIRKDRLPQDILPSYEKHNITGCVAVQARQVVEETDALIQLAKENPVIQGVVGWVDLRSDQVGEDLARYADIPVVKGFRHVVQDEPDVNFILREDFCRGIDQLDPARFTYDILVFPGQLPAVIQFVEKFPNHRFILDHIAKPDLKNKEYADWQKHVTALGKYNNLYCKLSGMITEADLANWKPEDIYPVIDIVIDAFGVDRLVYGSDWPVCLAAGTYDQVLNLVHERVGQLSPGAVAKIFYENGKRFYNL